MGGGELEFYFNQAGEFGAEAFVFVDGSAGFAGEGADADAAVGFVADDGIDLGAAEPLEEQVGGAIIVFLAGADDAEAGDAVLGLRIFRLAELT